METVLEAMNKLMDELAGLGRDIRALRDAMQPGADPGDEHREAPMPPRPHCGKADAVRVLKDEPHPMPDCVHDWERVPDPSGNNDSCYACRRCGRRADNRPTPAQPDAFAAVRELLHAIDTMRTWYNNASRDEQKARRQAVYDAQHRVEATLPTTLRLLPEGHVAVPREVAVKWHARMSQYDNRISFNHDAQALLAAIDAALKETP